MANIQGGQKTDMYVKRSKTIQFSALSQHSIAALVTALIACLPTLWLIHLVHRKITELDKKIKVSTVKIIFCATV